MRFKITFYFDNTNLYKNLNDYFNYTKPHATQVYVQ